MQSPVEVLCKVKDAEQIQRRAAAIFLYLKASEVCCIYIVPSEFSCQWRKQWRECVFATCRTLFQMIDRVENGGIQICHGL